MHKRGSGLLLHIVSLPSPYGIGDLGPKAYSFVDFLARCHQSYWQVLPINPVSPQSDYSPYSSISSFGIDILLLSPDLLFHDKLITAADLTFDCETPEYCVSYDQSRQFKLTLLDKAFQTAQKNGLGSSFDLFCEKHHEWLDDHALFVALSNHFQGLPWNLWPKNLRDRQQSELTDATKQFNEFILKEKFSQFILFNQWERLKSYCHSKGIQIIGDLPMFVSFHSADVWANRENFKLNEQLQPIFYAGAPPDRFNSSGQIWHNPVYNWSTLQNTQFYWWTIRFERSFELFDILRIDHFRGLVAYWEIPANSPNGMNGTWQNVPVDKFFNTMFKHFFCFPVIAEDLGTIGADVRETMSRLQFPGTKVLLFAFESEQSNHPYLPHTYDRNCMACTGTHDTNTLKGWFENDASQSEKTNLSRYLGESILAEQINWKMIQLLMMSAADMVIFPMQDLLNLGSESRMNTPGTHTKNWRWRFTQDAITAKLCDRFAEMTIIYGRE